MASNLHDIRSRSGENARRTRVERARYAPPQMGGGGHFREKSALEAAFSAFRAVLDDGRPRRVAAPSFRVFHPCRNVPADLQGHFVACRKSSCKLQGHFVARQNLPADCRAILSPDKTLLQIAGPFCRPTKPSCRFAGPFCRPTKPSCRLQGHFVARRKSSCRFAGTKPTCSKTPFRAEKTQKQAKRRKTWHYHL